MLLYTLGLAQPGRRAVLLLLLACAPLPDAVTTDVPIGEIAVGVVVVVL
jgi:hypothetical protein